MLELSALPLFIACSATFSSKHTVAQGFSTPKPGESHEMFAAEEVTWKYQVEMYINGPDGPPEKCTATEVNKLVSSGFYQKWKSKSNMVDQDFEGHGLIGYEPKEKRYYGMWRDNFIAAPTRMTAQYNKVEKILIVMSIVQEEEGNVIKQRRVTMHFDDITKRFGIFLVVETDDKEMEINLMSMKTRKQ